MLVHRMEKQSALALCRLACCLIGSTAGVLAFRAYLAGRRALGVFEFAVLRSSLVRWVLVLRINRHNISFQQEIIESSKLLVTPLLVRLHRDALRSN